MKFLVDLRADNLRLAGNPDITDAEAGALEQVGLELKAQLSTLFDVGLLDLRRITWFAPASLLEKLIEYEAVHTIHSWADLKNRLDWDRRCYAFFHPSMPDEPLVFVEIALTTGTPAVLAPLLDAAAPDVDPEQADTAVFYSISNCQPGLTGVNLGTALIEQVVEHLRRDLPRLQRFVTLSPIPGYRAVARDDAARRRSEAARTHPAARVAGAGAGPRRAPRVGQRRGDPARAGRVVRALPHVDARRPRRRPGRELPSRRTAR